MTDLNARELERLEEAVIIALREAARDFGGDQSSFVSFAANRIRAALWRSQRLDLLAHEFQFLSVLEGTHLDVTAFRRNILAESAVLF